MGLFLPFTDNGRLTEQAAIVVKSKLGFGAYNGLDPYRALSAIPARLVNFGQLPAELQAVLSGPLRDEWSAVGYGPSPADGVELILVNPTHHPNRQRVSLMEEVVHIVSGHPKVRLSNGNGAWTRTYSRGQEDDAFNIGAACIIPYKALFNAIRDEKLSAEEIAERYSVSVPCVEFRLKRAGLYRMYQKQHLHR